MTNLRSVLIIVVFSSIIFTGCQSKTEQTSTSLQQAKREIAKSNKLYFQGFSRGDSSIFLARYASDCCIMPPNAPMICGQDAALNFFRFAYQNLGLRDGRFISKEVYGLDENFVCEVGLFVLYKGDKTEIDRGKYLVLWKKTPAGWQMFRDSFSSDKSVLAPGSTGYRSDRTDLPTGFGQVF